MTRGRLALWAIAALSLAGLVAVVWAAAVARGEPIEIRIHYSHYTPDDVQVHAGAPVTFVLVNDDPIDHEWIVGDDAVHARHRTGTEPLHSSRPTEISIPALATRTTTVTFATPGSFKFICHLPGHEAYGMVGVVTVVP